MINDDIHRRHLAELRLAISATRLELGQTMEKAEYLETRVAHLQAIATATARLLGEDYIPEDSLGLTDAIRQAFKTAPNAQMNAIGVRDRLKQMGFNLTQYGNVLASIHTVLGRLRDKGEIKPTGMIGNSQAFMLNPTPPQMTPPPVLGGGLKIPK